MADKSECMAGLTIIIGIIAICVGIPYIANWEETKDYNAHSGCIGDTIVVNGDTCKILEWRTGRFDKSRGYVLSNGMTVDELVVKNCKDSIK